MNTDVQDQDFFTRMADVIAYRYQLNADKTVKDVYQIHAGFLAHPSDTDFVTHYRGEILQVLADPQKVEQLLALFIDRTIEFTYASNQFIQFNSAEKAELRRIYTAYLQALEQMLFKSHTPAEITAGVSALVAGHFQDLREHVTRFFDPEAAEDAYSNVILQKVVCAEYTPAMQLEILGVCLETLVQPVLDLGCGKSGRLVQYLRQNGIRAAGIDRVVDRLPGLSQADWLDYPMQPGQWGTIISHMAFSNHFQFHHLYRHGSVEPYARQYMAILKSLKAQGSFYYAPALPFIEVYLPAEMYTVTGKEIVAGNQIITGNQLAACRVLRNA